MAIADFLKGIGSGLEKGAKVAGSVLEPIGERTAEVVSGEAPQIDAERRQQGQQAIEAKAQQLEAQLEMGRKYGTLTPDQQKQYVDEIAKLYSHPSQMGTLVQRLHKAIHPGGSTYQAPALPDATPKGGTAAADEETAQRLAQARYAGARANNPRLVSLDSFTTEHFGTDFNASTPEQQEAALEAYGKSTRAQKMTTKIVVDPDSPTGFSAATWNTETGAMLSKFPGVTPPRGFFPTERLSRSTDQFGNVTETISETKPEIPGVPSQPVPVTHESTNAKPTKPKVSSVIPKGPASTGAKAVTPHAEAMKAPQRGQLDANGHIPSGVANPQVVELANELLDGRDAKDLPMKGRAPAEALARQYGWEQGTFTPKEKILINEAGAKLAQLRNSPSLAVLNNTGSRLRIAQVLQSADKQGFIGRTASALTAGSLSPQEQEFVRDYNAAVGVVSGLAPLTRGGRPTEASIARLMQEMPSVLQSSSSDDAKQRIDQLLQEIQVAAGTKGTTPLGATSQPISVGKAIGGKTINVSPDEVQ